MEFNSRATLWNEQRTTRSFHRRSPPRPEPAALAPMNPYRGPKSTFAVREGPSLLLSVRIMKPVASRDARRVC